MKHSADVQQTRDFHAVLAWRKEQRRWEKLVSFSPPREKLIVGLRRHVHVKAYFAAAPCWSEMSADSPPRPTMMMMTRSERRAMCADLVSP